MTCRHVKLPDGGTAIICGSRRQAMTACHICRAPATALCDFKLPNGKDCSRPCCATHSVKPDPDNMPNLDYCFLHWEERWNN